MQRIQSAIAAFGLLVACCGQANAALFLDGNTQPNNGSPSTVAGFINFEVYNRTGGVAGDSFDTGIAGFDAALAAAGFSTSSNWLYLYQSTDSRVDISQNTVGAAAAFVTGVGFLGADGFFVSAGTPVDLTHQIGGPAPAGNPSGTLFGAKTSFIGAVAGLVSPTSVASGVSSVQANFATPTGLTGTSSLWGYTASTPPVLGPTSIQDGGLSVIGTVPLPAIPEPATLVIWSLLGMCFAGCAYRRRAV